MNLEASQVIIQIFGFLIMLWVLKKFGWKPVLKMLNDRKEKIQSEFDNIAMQKEEIKKITETYEMKLKGIETEARHKIQEGITKGRLIAAKIQDEALINAREIAAKSRTDIEKELDKARNQLKGDLVKMTIAISEKIIREKLDDATHKKLITEFIEGAKL